MTSPAALHSNESEEHYSPTTIGDLAHATMGRVDLDPFSCALANRAIRASYFYSLPAEDGYSEEWGDGSTAVFCNPPSSKVKRKPERAPKALVKPGAVHAWWKLLDEYNAGRVEQALFLSFNMNLFQTAQRFGYPAPFEFPFVVPSKRLKFWGVDRAEGEGSPSHASAVIYLPPKSAHWGDWGKTLADQFHQAAKPLGRVSLGEWG